MNYCGWIPSVTGHLSFSAVGESSYPNRSICARSGRSVFFFQKRDLLDIVAPFAYETPIGAFFQEFIANYAVGVSGNFAFVFFGELAADRQSLRASVLLIPGKNNRPLLKETKRKVYEWQDAELANLTEWSNFFDKLRNSSCASCEVAMYRSGKAALQVSLNGEANPDKELEALVANQFFYFLKDNAHVHQHHDPTHDAITTVTELCREDDDAWILSTQHSLYRAVIRYKRFRNEKALFRASGILAYAQSFEKACGKNCDSLLEFNREELRASLDIARDEIKHFDAKRTSFIETIRNFFFAVFGLVISLMLILRFDEEVTISVPSEFAAAADIVINRYWLVGSVVVILSFGYAIAAHRVDPAQWGLIRAGHRLFQGFRLRWLFAFNAFMTIVFTALCFFFLSRLA